MQQRITPNDLLALSSLVVVPAIWLEAHRHPLWSLLLLWAACASVAYHVAETKVVHDLGIPIMSGASWAQRLQPFQADLLQQHRLSATCVAVATLMDSGGVSQIATRFLQAPQLSVWMALGVAALLAAERLDRAGWQYAALHSLWHMFAVTSMWLLLEAKSLRLARADVLVVGLGASKAEQQGTRQSVGSDVIRELANRWQVALVTEHELFRSGRIQQHGQSVVLAQTKVCGNSSGRAVEALCKAHGVSPGPCLVVVHDELALTPGRVKVVKMHRTIANSSHIGLRAVVQQLKSRSFTRVCVGIGMPPDSTDVGWLQARLDPRAANTLKVGRGRAVEAVEMIVEVGSVRAVAQLNVRSVPKSLWDAPEEMEID